MNGKTPNGTRRETISRRSRRGRVALSPEAANHLRRAMDQMDLLLRTPHPETALPHLIFLLQRLREVRKAARL